MHSTRRISAAERPRYVAAGGSKVDEAYVALKRAIVSGALAPEPESTRTSGGASRRLATFDHDRDQSARL